MVLKTKERKFYCIKYLNILILCLTISIANYIGLPYWENNNAYAASMTDFEYQLKYITSNLLYMSQECEQLSRFETKFEKPFLDIHPLNLDEDAELRKDLVNFSLKNRYKVKITSYQYVPDSFDSITNTVKFDVFERIEFQIRDGVPVDPSANNLLKYEEYFWRYTFKLPNNKNEVPKALNRIKRTNDLIEKQVTNVAIVRYDDVKPTRWSGFRDYAETRRLKKGERVSITINAYNDDRKSAYCLIYDDKQDKILGWVEKYQLDILQ